MCTLELVAVMRHSIELYPPLVYKQVQVVRKKGVLVHIVIR